MDRWRLCGGFPGGHLREITAEGRIRFRSRIPYHIVRQCLREAAVKPGMTGRRDGRPASRGGPADIVEDDAPP